MNPRGKRIRVDFRETGSVIFEEFTAGKLSGDFFQVAQQQEKQINNTREKVSR
jgi:hypothetical protein